MYSSNKFGTLPPANELVHGRGCLDHHNTLTYEDRRNVHHQWRAMAEESNSHQRHLRSSSILSLWRLGKLRPVITTAKRLRGSRGPHRVDVSPRRVQCFLSTAIYRELVPPKYPSLKRRSSHYKSLRSRRPLDVVYPCSMIVLVIVSMIVIT